MSTTTWNFYGTETSAMVEPYPVDSSKLYDGNF